MTVVYINRVAAKLVLCVRENYRSSYVGIARGGSFGSLTRFLSIDADVLSRFDALSAFDGVVIEWVANRKSKQPFDGDAK